MEAFCNLSNGLTEGVCNLSNGLTDRVCNLSNGLTTKSRLRKMLSRRHLADRRPNI
jgi:hypothetical protein